uniref:Uncharacterized protein n=1 Tax=Anguilla anguilla TaxID=7936 RepID=A0A0E9TFD4_ANGAN
MSLAIRQCMDGMGLTVRCHYYVVVDSASFSVFVVIEHGHSCVSRGVF